MGIFSRAAGFIEGLYGKAVESAPARAFGAVTGVAGNVIARATTAVASPIVQQGLETFAGKTEEEAKAIVDKARQQSIRETTQFGQRIGAEGLVASATGGAGRVANVALAAPTVIRGAEDLKQGNYVAGALQVGLGLVGGYAGMRGPTLRQSVSEVTPLFSRAGRAVTSPVQTARGIMARRSVSGTVTQDIAQTADEMTAALKTQADEMVRGQNSSSARVANLFPETVDDAVDVVDESARITRQDVADAVVEAKKENFADLRTKNNKYSEAARKAVNSDGSANPKNPTPFEIEGDDITSTVRGLREQMKIVGKEKSDIVKNSTKTFTDTGIQGDFANVIEDRLGARVISDADGNFTITAAPGRTLKITDPSDQKIVIETMKDLSELNGKGVLEVDDLVDRMQGRVTYKAGAIAPNTAVEGAVKSATKKLNETLKAQLPKQYRKLNAQYGLLKNVTTWADKNLGPEQVRAGALVKRIFSPSDAGTKKMLTLIKALTGKDHISGAILAMEAMKSVKDPRAASLLEGVIMQREILDVIGNIPVAGQFVQLAEKASKKLVNSESLQKAVDDLLAAAEKSAYENADNATKAQMVAPRTISEEEISGAIKEISKDEDVTKYVEAITNTNLETLYSVLVRPSVTLSAGRLSEQEKTEGRKRQLIQDLQSTKNQTLPDVSKLQEILDRKRQEKSAQQPVQGAFE